MGSLLRLLSLLLLAVHSVTCQGTGRKSDFLNEFGLFKSAASHAVNKYLGFSGIPVKDTKVRSQSTDSSYCDVDIGCFSTRDPEFWHPLYRPFNMLPVSREMIGTKYLLFTRTNPKEPFVLKLAPKGQPLEKSGPMGLLKPIKVLIPGWMDSRTFLKWIDEMKDQLLLNDDVNVIIVAWTDNHNLPYSRAVANTRVVGAELALLLQNIQVSGASLGKVHLIGHSLGSHLAGYTGERLVGLGRITGLDPAGPYFQGMPPRVRLDPSDADFVDVWHTDGGPLYKLGLGMDDAVGHVDFYPNGGKEQPGCSTQRITTIVTEGLVMGFRRFLGCNHERAIQLYLQLLNTYKGVENACRTWAYPCPDWETFQGGHCGRCGGSGQFCATMDLDVTMTTTQIRKRDNESKPLRLYLKTNSAAPYCLHHYQIIFQVASSTSAKSQNGKLILHAQDIQNRDVKLTLGERSLELYPGATYRHLVTSGQRLDLDRSKVRLEYKPDRMKLLEIIFKSKIYVERLTIKKMEPFLKNGTGMEDGINWIFSIPKGKPLKSGEPVTLTPL